MVFFFAIVCSIRSNQQQQTSVLSPHSPQPCCVSSMMIVFPFGGVFFHEAGCGSAFLSATETLRTQAAQLILVCLFIFFGPMSVVTTPSSVLVRNCICLQSILRSSDVRSQQFFWTLLLVFVSWFGLTLCDRILFAFRCEPVCRTRPCACLVLLAAHLHSQGADILDVFGLVSSFLRLCCTSCDLSCTQQPRAHLLRVGVLHICPAATSRLCT